MTREEMSLIKNIKNKISKKYNINTHNIFLEYLEYNDYFGVLIQCYRFFTYIDGLKYECQNICLTTLILNIEKGLFKEEIRDDKLNILLK